MFLGVIKDDSFLTGMMKEATGPLNFTMFLTFMGDKLQNTDTDDTLVSAFLTIDSENTGLIPKTQ
jgi:Ca2+-binding EF-hand superfamily protein